MRCLTEFQLAFGFPLRTLMIPLEGSAPPRLPGAARKSFTFVDSQGREVWTTSRSHADQDAFTIHDDVVGAFTVYDVGA